MATIAENLQVIKESLYNIKTTIENHGGIVGDISTYAEALEEIFSKYEEETTPSPSTPGPSTPGPSTPGPSTPGPSTPDPSTETTTPAP